jgi:glucan phosphoethanolaminetransferase (alkaline phosphatase superfamily)
MWFLKFWLISSIACFVSFLILIFYLYSEFKQNYKYDKSKFAEKVPIITWIYITVEYLLMSIIPLVNIILIFWLFLGNHDDVLEEIAKKYKIDPKDK